MNKREHKLKLRELEDGNKTQKEANIILRYQPKRNFYPRAVLRFVQNSSSRINKKPHSGWREWKEFRKSPPQPRAARLCRPFNFEFSRHNYNLTAADRYCRRICCTYTYSPSCKWVWDGLKIKYHLCWPVAAHINSCSPRQCSWYSSASDGSPRIEPRERVDAAAAPLQQKLPLAIQMIDSATRKLWVGQVGQV